MVGIATTVTGLRAQVDAPNGSGKVTPAIKSPAKEAGESSGVVRTAMKNVEYHLTDRVVVHIGDLNGKLVTKPGETVVFDDKNSFAIEADFADIRIGMTALTNDLNDYIFARADAPLKNLVASVKTDKHGDELMIKGLLVSKGGVPFETAGTLSVTPEGWIRVSTHSVKALKLPIHGLMEMLGLDTANLVNTNKVEGVKIDKDDLLIDPQHILPPPEFKGKLTGVKIDNGEIALTFGDKKAGKPMSSLCGGRNYISFQGGTVKFGSLTMSNALLELVDADPQDSYDFALAHYVDQLSAGYVKSLKSGALCAHTPDLNKIKTAASGKK